VDKGEKLLGLEVLRFSSAIAILIWHYQHFSFIGTELVNFERQQQPFYNLFYLFYNYGGAGVQIFWTLSGFIFAYNYSSKIRNRVVSTKKFFVARFSRLYPLHLLTLCLVAILQLIYGAVSRGKQFVYSENSFSDFLLHLFFANAWGLDNRIGFNGPVWSVSIEILVYAIFFLHARFLSYGKVSTFSILVIALTSESLFPEYVLLDAVIYFYAGCLVHIIFSDRKKNNNRSRQLWLSWFGFLVVIMGAAFIMTSSATTAISISENRYFMPALILFSVAFLIVITAPWRPKNSSLGRSLETLGDLTYSSYLLHFPLQLVVTTIYLGTGQVVPWGNGWFFVTYLFVVLGLSYTTFRFFELPAKSYFRRVFY
jgi:peptidoglycan/LPS O-acetylase OafA/YrhL